MANRTRIHRNGPRRGQDPQRMRQRYPSRCLPADLIGSCTDLIAEIVVLFVGG